MMTTDEQIELYCEQKEQEKALNKSIKKLNADIKESLTKTNQTTVEAGKYSVTLEKRVTDNIDTVKMLMIMKTYWEEHYEGKCPFIRTVEVLDDTELEAFLYKEKLPDDVIIALGGCRSKTETTALTYKIKKEK